MPNLALMPDTPPKSLNLSSLTAMDVRVRDVMVATIDDGHVVGVDDARAMALDDPPLVLNRVLAARRLGLQTLVAYDLLELFAFVRPARFTVPTVEGLADSLGLSLSLDTRSDRTAALFAIAQRLLADLASDTYRYRAGADRLAAALARADWAWGPLVLDALSHSPKPRREEDGFAVWVPLREWEDQAPPPPPGDAPVSPEDSRNRLEDILGVATKDGQTQAEVREGQQRYAAAATHVFSPREMQDGPNLQLLEAGTGTGKTLGYLAPASLWAEKNGAPVWLATYTKNLQRQLDVEMAKLYPDPKIRRAKTVIRKGRENYLCLLNMEEIARAVMGRLALNASDPDLVLVALVARWARFSRDGDMVGGDFPGWLGAHFGTARIMSLTDRRGECLYAACAHYRKCFVEKAARASRGADLVVANHALVMAQAVNRAGDPDLPKRVVFDEGHHVFDAADSAFATHLSGAEGRELRRWLRGKEQSGSTRARGLKSRLDDLITDAPDSVRDALDAVLEAARFLPSDGWLSRVAGAAAMTDFEGFLLHVRDHVLTRSVDADSPHGLESPVTAPSAAMMTAARTLAPKIEGLARAMTALVKGLLLYLDDEADSLESGERGRIESAARSLELRVHQTLAWRDMVMSLEDMAGPTKGEGAYASGINTSGNHDHDHDRDFVDWFALDRIGGRDVDVGLSRHFLDPTAPFAKAVLTPLHGALITSATLRDHGVNKQADSPQPTPSVSQSITPAAPESEPMASEPAPQPEPSGDWRHADMRTGAQHMLVPARRLMVASPFDYKAQVEFLVVGDVNKNSPDQLAAAVRALSFAAGGGTLALFTAIRRLRETYDRVIGAFEDHDLPLYAQHVDPIDVATLTAMFRADRDSTLFGTDAVRDGVDVPGDSLRLIVFDRVPWPRPTLLHKARRDAFGGRTYDEMLTRAKLAQAFGRLIRRANDFGTFVMLDGQTPTRLLDGLPDGVTPVRLGLAEAVSRVTARLATQQKAG